MSGPIAVCEHCGWKGEELAQDELNWVWFGCMVNNEPMSGPIAVSEHCLERGRVGAR